MIKVWAVAYLIFLDGIRRYSLIGLFVLACALEIAGLLFVDFLPRDVGRASCDFVLSVGWVTGFLFLLFHGVNVAAWGDDRRPMQTLLARPITRWHYVVGLFCGLALLLIVLKVALGILGFAILSLIREAIGVVYFVRIDTVYYLLSWGGLFYIELMVLAVIVLFSGLVRGGFILLLMTVSYYFICSGLPVVREAFFNQGSASAGGLAFVLKCLSAFFPDFNQLDFKHQITHQFDQQTFPLIALDFFVSFLYIGIVLGLAAIVYKKRDLQ